MMNSMTVNICLYFFSDNVQTNIFLLNVNAKHFMLFRINAKKVWSINFFFLKCYLPSLKVFANSVMFLNPLLALKSRQPRRSRHETNHIQTYKSRSSKSKQIKLWHKHQIWEDKDNVILKLKSTKITFILKPL